jgi:hypothetical protein
MLLSNRQKTLTVKFSKRTGKNTFEGTVVKSKDKDYRKGDTSKYWNRDSFDKDLRQTVQ